MKHGFMLTGSFDRFYSTLNQRTNEQTFNVDLLVRNGERGTVVVRVRNIKNESEFRNMKQGQEVSLSVFFSAYNNKLYVYHA